MLVVAIYRHTLLKIPAASEINTTKVHTGLLSKLPQLGYNLGLPGYYRVCDRTRNLKVEIASTYLPDPTAHARGNAN